VGLPADTADRGSTELSVELDATESVELLLRDLRSSRTGLSTSEEQRRLLLYGPNELRRRGGLKWPGELARQLTHPLALLLSLAAALSFAVGSLTIAVAVLLVILLNALFAFIQEMQAERAVEALAQFLPSTSPSCATEHQPPSWPPTWCHGRHRAGRGGRPHRRRYATHLRWRGGPCTISCSCSPYPFIVWGADELRRWLIRRHTRA
jgi:hypothetical protein